MTDPTQRQQERISKSSSDRLRTQLVPSGVADGEMAQMDRGELKAAAAQVEAERPGSVDGRQQPLPDEGEELFLPPQGAAPKYEVLKMKMGLRKMELEAEKEARQGEAEAEARKAERAAEAEARKAEREAEARKAEREAEARKAEADRETRKL